MLIFLTNHVTLTAEYLPETLNNRADFQGNQNVIK